MSDNRRLVFLKWDLPLEREESVVGYFERTIERNGETSLGRFNYVNGLRKQAVSPEEKLEILLRHPLSDELKANLSDATLRLTDERTIDGTPIYALRGQQLVTTDWSWNRRRWCPACLAEKSYRRLWFDIVAIKICPYHRGVELTARDVHGDLVPWYRGSFASVDVERRTEWPPNQLQENTLGRYVLGRLGCEAPMQVPALDALKLTTAIWACETVGVLLSRQRMKVAYKSVLPHESDVGLAALREGPGFLAQALRDWVVEKLSSEQKAMNTGDIFTWAYGRACSKGFYDFGPYLIAAFHGAMSSLRRSMVGTVSDEDVVGARLSIQAAADQLGVAVKFAGLAARNLGFLEDTSMRRRSLLSRHVDAIQQHLDALMSTKEFCDTTGLPKEAGTYLIRAGELRGYFGSIRGEMGPWFHRSYVADMMSKVRALPTTGNMRHGFAFRTVVLKDHQPPGRLVEQLLRGERNIVYMDPDSDFRGIFVECMDKVNTVHKREIGSGPMLIADAAVAIGVTRRTVKRLIADGHITTLDGSKRPLLDRSQVEAFASQYITGTAVAFHMGKTNNVVMRMARSIGLEPFVRAVRTSYHDTLFERCDAERAFERPFPPLCLDEEAVEAWSSFVERARQVYPGIRIPVRLPSAGSWVGSVHMDRAVSFCFLPDLRVLRFHFPRTTGCSHDIAVGHPHRPEDFDIVLEEVRSITNKLNEAATKRARARMNYKAKTVASTFRRGASHKKKS